MRLMGPVPGGQQQRLAVQHPGRWLHRQQLGMRLGPRPPPLPPCCFGCHPILAPPARRCHCAQSVVPPPPLQRDDPTVQRVWDGLAAAAEEEEVVAAAVVEAVEAVAVAVPVVVAAWELERRVGIRI